MLEKADFGMRIAELRISKGASARDMSLSIGQNPGYMNNIENGHNYPSMEAFFYICEYLDVTPSEFFDDGNSHPSEYREMQKDMEALDEKSRQNVLAIIKGLKR